jgi:hypothetical protein
MKCLWCGTENVRVSRFQLQDLIRLPALQYPMRCRDCLKREYRSVFLILASSLAGRAGRGQVASGKRAPEGNSAPDAKR